MAYRALNTDRGKRLAILGEESGHAYKGIGFQQEKCAGRIGQIDLTFAERIGDILGNGVHVDLQAEFESFLGAEAGSHAAEFFPGNCFVKLELAAPEILAAERIESECLAAFLQIPLGQLGGGRIELFAAHLSGGRYQS